MKQRRMKERQKSENQRVLTFKKTTSQVMVTDRREMRQMKNQSVKEQEAEIKKHKNLVG